MVDDALRSFLLRHRDINMLSGKPDDHVIELIHGPGSATEGAGLETPFEWKMYLSRLSLQNVFLDSLLNRDYEWELLPLGRDQGLGGLIWSPLGWGKLTGKIRRGEPAKPGTRAHSIPQTGPRYEEERLFAIVDALRGIAEETGKTIPQIALNWLLRRPTVANVIIGARDEHQLIENIGAVGWKLAPEQVAKLDAASDVTPVYPFGISAAFGCSMKGRLWRAEASVKQPHGCI
jgi:hypothetical protein